MVEPQREGGRFSRAHRFSGTPKVQAVGRNRSDSLLRKNFVVRVDVPPFITLETGVQI